jgi:formate hydrogenlyase subunit 6/NADH:ubiquinone oxidoreductase subunit I
LAFDHIFRKRLTIKHPFVLLKPTERTIGRHRLFLDKCIGCGLCVKICPCSTIKLVEIDGKKYPQIDYGRCCFCNFCVYYCPRQALRITSEYEIAAYDKTALVYSPKQLSTLPDLGKGRKTLIVKLFKRGASHIESKR